ATTDNSPPAIISFSTADLDGNGRIDQVTFTFCETLKGAQQDIAAWTLVDADGQTNLLAGLSTSYIAIIGNQVVLTLANTGGTAGTPRYQYSSNGIGGTLQDLVGNVVLKTTNNSDPIAKAGPDQSVIPSLVTLDASASFDPDHQPLTYRWNQIG